MIGTDVRASGWVILYRSLFDHAAFRSRIESCAFAWMIATAAWRPTRVRYKGIAIDLERGELAISTRDLAAAFEWSEAKARRYLNRLQRDAMIDARSDAGVNVILICNYDVYQLPMDGTDAPSDAPPTQQRRTADAQNNKGKEGKKEKKESKEGGRQIASPSNRGTRLPQDWQPDSTLAAWAVDQFGEIDVRDAESLVSREVQKFIDHWHSLAGARAVKLDWNAAFRNWIRRAIEFRGNGKQNPRRPTPGEQMSDAFERLRREIDGTGDAQPNMFDGVTIDGTPEHTSDQ